MSLRASADFLFSVKGMKFIPLNGDLSTPLPLTGGVPSAVIAKGGVGPFDFSGVASPTATPMTIKIDNGTPETQNLDVGTGTGSVDESAVTAAELAAAITAAGFTGVTASVSSEGYVQIAITTVTTEIYLQVYGEAAEIGEFGQGYGLQFVIADTQQSNAVTPTVQEPETITILDSNGKNTEVISDGYRKGWTGVFTDTAMDNEIRKIIEGGTIDETNDTYTPPNSDSVQKYFAIEVHRVKYKKGSNLELNQSGHVLDRYYIATGTFGDDPGDRNFIAHVYNLVGTEYKDPVTSAIYSDSMRQEFSNADWDALDWYNI